MGCAQSAALTSLVTADCFTESVVRLLADGLVYHLRFEILAIENVAKI